MDMTHAPETGSFRMKTVDLHRLGWVSITDARFLSPALLARLDDAEKPTASPSAAHSGSS